MPAFWPRLFYAAASASGKHLHATTLGTALLLLILVAAVWAGTIEAHGGPSSKGRR